jgi:hypothetical protein
MIYDLNNNITIDRKTKTITTPHGTWSAPSKKCGHVAFIITQTMLLAGWITTKRLFDVIYGDDEDGGPVHGPGQIHLLFYQYKYRAHPIPIWPRLGLSLQARPLQKINKKKCSNEKEYSLALVKDGLNLCK